MNILLIGNFISLIGCTLMVAGGFIKEKKKILLVQSFQLAFQGTANLILGAYAGFVSGVVCIVRNIVFSRKDSTAALKLLFIAVQIVLSILPGNFTAIETLPIFTAVITTWYIDVKDEVFFKKVIILSCFFWLVYDSIYLNLVGAAFDLFSIASNMTGIYMIQKLAKTQSHQ